jgi:hypothetical protein
MKRLRYNKPSKKRKYNTFVDNQNHDGKITVDVYSVIENQKNRSVNRNLNILSKRKSDQIVFIEPHFSQDKKKCFNANANIAAEAHFEEHVGVMGFINKYDECVESLEYMKTAFL